MPGFYLNNSNQIAECPPGFFCPVTIECRIGCLPGAYCPPAPDLVSVNATANKTTSNSTCAQDGGEVCTCGVGGAPPSVFNILNQTTKMRAGVGCVPLRDLSLGPYPHWGLSLGAPVRNSACKCMLQPHLRVRRLRKTGSLNSRCGSPNRNWVQVHLPRQHG
jgi:hypothetical protein